MEEWIKKIICKEYYPATEKKEILPFVTTWMNPEGIMLSEVSQTEKGKYELTCLWNLKKAKITETESKMVVTRGWRGWKWGNIDDYINRMMTTVNTLESC